MLLSMLAGLDRMKRLFAVPPGPESESARAARIVDLFLKAHQR
jgi:VanZ family protein